jgi:hypothetical protein
MSNKIYRPCTYYVMLKNHHQHVGFGVLVQIPPIQAIFDNKYLSLVKENTFDAMPCSQTECYMILNHWTMDSIEHVIEIITRNYTSYHPGLFSSLLECTLNPRLFHYVLQGGPLRSLYLVTHQGSIDVDMIPHLVPGT